ncbi:quercetin dioxygenase-like cupin family protein [Filimonas zeae]|uniref:Cupin n=1 Tax=Filimonas zeae TaxID=1737353 RepID=A0A917J161_9BACT|nr:cupin domain-containing protein [Filimonas zeae]MDR6341464.1 quercetin dioxygenase-like cupin family protein [Filimonas zeae]GGH75744.1 cupin [Filimonas zeae]
MQQNTTKAFIEDASLDWQDMGGGVKRKIMCYDNRVMLVKVQFETGAVGALHSHFHTQISQVDSGVFEVEIAGEKKVLKAGDAFYVTPDAVHGVVCLEAGMLVDVFSPMREDFINQ